MFASTLTSTSLAADSRVTRIKTHSLFSHCRSFSHTFGRRESTLQPFCRFKYLCPLRQQGVRLSGQMCLLQRWSAALRTRPHTSHAVYFSHFLSILQLSVKLTTRPCSCGQSITPPPPVFSLSAHSCRRTTVLGGAPLPPHHPTTSTALAGCQICHLWKPSIFTDSICSGMGQWFGRTHWHKD